MDSLPHTAVAGKGRDLNVTEQPNTSAESDEAESLDADRLDLFIDDQLDEAFARLEDDFWRLATRALDEEYGPWPLED